MAPTIDELMQKVKILEDLIARKQDRIDQLNRLLKWHIETREIVEKRCDDAIKKFSWGL